MAENLKFRKAAQSDLKAIISLLFDDALGSTREVVAGEIHQNYTHAFEEIQKDSNQALMVVEKQGEIIGTCHLTLMPTLLYMGSTRLNIEAVRVKQDYQGQSIGSWMFQQVIEYAKTHGVTILQLTTNKQRTKAKVFYERLGFRATHEGMKLHL